MQSAVTIITGPADRAARDDSAGKPVRIAWLLGVGRHHHLRRPGQHPHRQRRRGHRRLHRPALGGAPGQRLRDRVRRLPHAERSRPAHCGRQAVIAAKLKQYVDARRRRPRPTTSCSPSVSTTCRSWRPPRPGDFALAVPAYPPGCALLAQAAPSAAIGVILGLVLGVGLAFLREKLDTRLHDHREVGEIMGCRSIGRVAHIPVEALAKGSLVVMSEADGRAAESIRVLRSNLQFASLGEENRVLMVMSAQKGEGKSLVTANLAASLALAGKHVALVDADLRRPRVHSIFGIRNTRGVSSVIAGFCSLDDALQTYDLSGPRWSPSAATATGPSRSTQTALPRLTLLTSGPIPPNPGEMVASRRFAHAHPRARGKGFDYVLVDSPAFLAVGRRGGAGRRGRRHRAARQHEDDQQADPRGGPRLSRAAASRPSSAWSPSWTDRRQGRALPLLHQGRLERAAGSEAACGYGVVRYGLATRPEQLDERVDVPVGVVTLLESVSARSPMVSAQGSASAVRRASARATGSPARNSSPAPVPWRSVVHRAEVRGDHRRAAGEALEQGVGHVLVPERRHDRDQRALEELDDGGLVELAAQGHAGDRSLPQPRADGLARRRRHVAGDHQLDVVADASAPQQLDGVEQHVDALDALDAADVADAPRPARARGRWTRPDERGEHAGSSRPADRPRPSSAA